MNAKAKTTERNWTNLYVHKTTKTDLLKTGHGGQTPNDLIERLVKIYNKARQKGLLKELDVESEA